ncbi:MAG: hypothetical protein NDI67_06930 [Sulfuritalea sp.]|nr:hypothetical protein [Sulfuritalea sp.]
MSAPSGLCSTLVLAMTGACATNQMTGRSRLMMVSEASTSPGKPGASPAPPN